MDAFLQTCGLVGELVDARVTGLYKFPKFDDRAVFFNYVDLHDRTLGEFLDKARV